MLARDSFLSPKWYSAWHGRVDAVVLRGFSTHQHEGPGWKSLMERLRI